MKKSAGKSSAKRVPKGVPRGTRIPLASGGYFIAGAGRGPQKGASNAGRPPDEWKKALRALADRWEVLAHVDAALLAGPRRPLLNDKGERVDRDGVKLSKDESTVYLGSDFFEAALQYVTDHGYGRATQPIEGNLTVRLEDLLGAVARAP